MPPLILLALGGAGAFILWGVKRSLDPTRVPEREKRMLASLKKKPLAALTIDDAENGAVLARRYGDKFAEGEFKKHIVKLRKTRAPI
jgi:hypothetical protein